MKFCTKCKLDKFDDDFSKTQFKKKSGFCKLCVKNYNDNYQKENKFKILIDKKEYYEKNKKIIIINARAYYKENKEEILKRHKIYDQNHKKERNFSQKIRRKNDSNYKLRTNISTLIGLSLRRNNGSKNGKSIINNTLYSIEELKKHLESLFESWMTWDNWGVYNSKTWDDNDQSTWTWQIDHIIPQSTFKYTSMEDEEFKACWALENLRPLSSKINIIEGSLRLRH